VSDKPDMKALAEQVRAFAQTPRMQELKRQVEALRQSPPEHIRKIRDELKEFSARQRMQLGQRGQSGLEPVKTKKRSRGRPSGAYYPEDSALITAMHREILTTGATKILPVARQFASAAKGSMEQLSKARRLERAYRKRFGSIVERKEPNFSP
jgi:hypothetical protein